ncbi:PcfJ domain-containing protein [Sphingomonas oryzagri]
MSTGLSFATLRSAALAELSVLLPAIAGRRDHPAVQAMVTVIALSRCRITVRARANEIAPQISVSPSCRQDETASALVDHVREAIAEPLHKPQIYYGCDLGEWLDGRGFIDLVIALIGNDVRPDAIQALLAPVSVAVHQLASRINAAAYDHFRTVAYRDLPGADTRRRMLSHAAHWALATSYVGNPCRPGILERRRQALSVYGALAGALRARAVTAAIDDGTPLNPPLAAELGLSVGHLRRFQHARGLHESVNADLDFARAVVRLKAHEVPLHQWPMPDQWEGSCWLTPVEPGLFRPDYIGTAVEIRDSLDALRQDILIPVAAGRALALGLAASHAVARFLYALSIPASLVGTEQHRAFLSGLRRAVVEPRGIKSFHEAILIWHRRAATVAAVRHEQMTDQPGWPALCPPWTSQDGRHSVMALTSAEALVEEGNALDHCVGGYYPQCRSGSTQILSLREDGRHAATAEILLTGGPGEPISMRVGQFKTFGDRQPPPALYAVLRAFLDDLQSGEHPSATRELSAYRRRMCDHYDSTWRMEALPLDHARRIWPLYRSLLPRGVGEDFDEWCSRSGVNHTFDAILTAIANLQEPAPLVIEDILETCS